MKSKNPRWRSMPFSDIATIPNGQVDPKHSPYDAMLVIGPEHMRSGGGLAPGQLQTARDLGMISGKYEFSAKHVLFSKIRPNLNKTCFPRFSGLCSADVYPVQFDDKVCLPEFGYQVLLSDIWLRPTVAASMRTGLPKVNRTDIETIEIPLPPIGQQRRIADALAVWDRAIETAEVLVAAKRHRRLGYLQRRVFGARSTEANTAGLSLTQKRLAGSNEWPIREIGDFATEVSRLNRAGDELPVLSCTKHSGIVLSADYFSGRRVHAEDTSSYKIVRRGEFVYATNHLEEGSIGLQNLADAGVVSPMYTVFGVDDALVDRDFLFAVLKTETYRQVFQINTAASVDRRGGLRWDEFSALPFALPSLSDQQAIASALTALDTDIASDVARLNALRTQKRGLMQKLLTGDWRLSSDASEQAA